MAEQMYLFGPSLNTTARLKAAMREAVSKSDLSREQIVDRMRSIAKVEGLGGGRGSTISLPNLDAWCSETKPNLIPVNLLTVFCKVVKDVTPIRILIDPLGATIVGSEKAKVLAWAEAEIQSRRLAKRKNRLMSEIKESVDGDF